MKTIEVKGNFLVVTDTVSGDIGKPFPRNNTRFYFEVDGETNYLVLVPISLVTVVNSSDNNLFFDVAEITGFEDLEELKEFLYVNLSGSNSPVLTLRSTGWGNYTDNVRISEVTAQLITANTDTSLINNAGTKIETQLPSHVDTFYDGTVITGRNGDNLDAMIYFYAIPSNNSQTMDIWIDITGGTGTPNNLANLYRQTINFPKGIGEPLGVLYSLPSAYTLDTWEANGGVVKIRTTHSLKVYGATYNFDLSHKAV